MNWNPMRQAFDLPDHDGDELFRRRANARLEPYTAGLVEQLRDHREVGCDPVIAVPADWPDRFAGSRVLDTPIVLGDVDEPTVRCGHVQHGPTADYGRDGRFLL